MIVCPDGSQTPGHAGTAGKRGVASNPSSCSTTVVAAAAARQLGFTPAPAGKTWAYLDCDSISVVASGRYLLIDAAKATPRVSPQQLLSRALGELKVPTLGPATAPPRGSDGLVGLPEWFWVPASSWHRVQVTVQDGPVWATATAVPERLSFLPAAGMAPVSCAGPGTAYDPAVPAAAQHTDCSYTYEQPSAHRPGGAYGAAVSVSWRISWTGSGGVGGLIDADMVVTVPLSITVTSGEALVTSS